jgi:hypothetical protein
MEKETNMTTVKEMGVWDHVMSCAWLFFALISLVVTTLAAHARNMP